MKRRYLPLLVFAAIIVLVASAWGVWRSLLPTPGMTKANFERIKIGMTVQEVDALLGRSPGWQGPIFAGNYCGAWAERAELVSGQAPKRKVVWGDGHDWGFVEIQVGLDEQERVVSGSYWWWNRGTYDESFLDFFRRHLGL